MRGGLCALFLSLAVLASGVGCDGDAGSPSAAGSADVARDASSDGAGDSGTDAVEVSGDGVSEEVRPDASIDLFAARDAEPDVARDTDVHDGDGEATGEGVTAPVLLVCLAGGPCRAVSATSPPVVFGQAFLRPVLADGGPSVERVDFYFDGEAAATVDEAPYDVRWDTTRSPDGRHEVEAMVTFADGSRAGAAGAVLVRNCDRDGDGALAVGGPCGGDDCDDDDARVHPGAEDLPGDGVDADCDGADGIACPSPCSDGFVCDGYGRCVQPCDCGPIECGPHPNGLHCSGTDCGACTGDEVCRDGRCELEVCAAPCDERACQTCVGGECVSACAEGEACEEGACVAIDCFPGCYWGECETCVENVCVLSCRPEQCEVCDGAGRCLYACDPVTETCEAGECVPTSVATCAAPNEAGYCPAVVLSAYELSTPSDEAPGIARCCCDFDGDGAVDNAFGNFVRVTGPMADMAPEEINARIALGIAEGRVLEGFELVGLAPDADDTPRFDINYYVLEDADGDPTDNLTGAGRFTVAPTALDPGTGRPRVAWHDAALADGRLSAGPAVLPMTREDIALFVSLEGVQSAPLPFVDSSSFPLRGATLGADLRATADGLRLENGTLCGYVTMEALVAVFDDYFADHCGCLNLHRYMVAGAPGAYTCADLPAATCDPDDPQESTCLRVAQYCSTFVFSLPILLDLDWDGDGDGDAMSVGVRFEAVPAELVARPAAE